PVLREGRQPAQLLGRPALGLDPLALLVADRDAVLLAAGAGDVTVPALHDGQVLQRRHDGPGKRTGRPGGTAGYLGGFWGPARRPGPTRRRPIVATSGPACSLSKPASEPLATRRRAAWVGPGGPPGLVRPGIIVPDGAPDL